MSYSMSLLTKNPSSSLLQLFRYDIVPRKKEVTLRKIPERAIASTRFFNEGNFGVARHRDLSARLAPILHPCSRSVRVRGCVCAGIHAYMRVMWIFAPLSPWEETLLHGKTLIYRVGKRRGGGGTGEKRGKDSSTDSPCWIRNPAVYMYVYSRGIYGTHGWLGTPFHPDADAILIANVGDARSWDRATRRNGEHPGNGPDPRINRFLRFRGKRSPLPSNGRLGVSY